MAHQAAYSEVNSASGSMPLDISSIFEIHRITDDRRTTKFTVKEKIVLLFVKNLAPYVIEHCEFLTMDVSYDQESEKNVFSDSGSACSDEFSVLGDTITSFSETVTTLSNSEPESIPCDCKEQLLDFSQININAYIKFRNGNRYFGNFVNLQINGFGIFYWADGSKYEGEFLNNTITGKGKMTWSDLSWYEGEFLNGFRHGRGTFYMAYTPKLYHGKWRIGKKHGKGLMLYKKNSMYDGDFFNNMRQGFGEHSYSQGGYFCGEWVGDKRNGMGSMCWPNNDYYKGNFLNGQMHGFGEYIWNAVVNFNFNFPVEIIYRGDWKNGNREGLGELEFGNLNGIKYEGCFESNLKHGNGVIVCGNGSIIRGSPLFLYDKPVHIADNTNYHSAPLNRHKMIKLPRYSKRPSQMEYCPDCCRTVCKEYYKCETVEIAIHTPSHKIDLSYYVKQVKYLTDMDPDTEMTETKLAEKSVLINLLRLREVYNYYSNICTNDKKNRPVVMIRLFLWQMYRDCKINERISLIRTDQLLAACDTALINSVHDPFEKLYFWQFLHSLFCVAWDLYSSDWNISVGLLAACFNKFLREDIFPYAFKTTGCVLLKYLDVVPINVMYDFYRNISEPLPIRKFLTLLAPLNKLQMNNLILTSHAYKGRNTVPLGSNLFYKLVEPVALDGVNKNDGLHLLHVILHALKLERIIRILIKVCPAINNGDCIAHIDYQLTFLEFYEVLIHCLRIYDYLFKPNNNLLVHF